MVFSCVSLSRSFIFFVATTIKECRGADLVDESGDRAGVSVVHQREQKEVEGGCAVL